MGTSRPSEPRRRRERGDDGISWDKINKCYVGTISLGYDGQGKRRRRTVRGKTKAEVKDKLDEAARGDQGRHSTPATYTVRAVRQRLARLDSNSIRTPWPPIAARPRSGSIRRSAATKLKDFKATDADRFFREIAKVLSKRSLVMIKSTLRRSIRRAQKHDLIGRNVAELVDLPAGPAGTPVAGHDRGAGGQGARRPPSGTGERRTSRS